MNKGIAVQLLTDQSNLVDERTVRDNLSLH